MRTDLKNLACEVKAKAVLRLRSDIERAGYRNEMHGIILPSFGDYVRYDLLTSKEATKALGIKTVWRHQDDLARFRDPVTEVAARLSKGHNPTFEIREVTVAPDIAETLVKSAAKISIAAKIASFHFGLDGTSYEIGFGDSFAWATFHWWQESPVGWEVLADMLRDLSEAIEQAG
jgi:hypothetical protein